MEETPSSGNPNPQVHVDRSVERPEKEVVDTGVSAVQQDEPRLTPAFVEGHYDALRTPMQENEKNKRIESVRTQLTYEEQTDDSSKSEDETSSFSSGSEAAKMRRKKTKHTQKMKKKISPGKRKGKEEIGHAAEASSRPQVRQGRGSPWISPSPAPTQVLAAPRRNHEAYFSSKGRTTQPYSPAQRRNTHFTSLTKTPCEILATEAVRRSFTQPAPLKGNPEGKFADRYCEFHGDKRRYTNDCYQLRKQIEEAVQSGQLSHLEKEIKQVGTKQQERQGTSQKNKPRVIQMVRSERNEGKRPMDEVESWMHQEISFPPSNQVSQGP